MEKLIVESDVSLKVRVESNDPEALYMNVADLLVTVEETVIENLTTHGVIPQEVVAENLKISIKE